MQNVAISGVASSQPTRQRGEALGDLAARLKGGTRMSAPRLTLKQVCASLSAELAANETSQSQCAGSHQQEAARLRYRGRIRRHRDVVQSNPRWIVAEREADGVVASTCLGEAEQLPSTASVRVGSGVHRVSVPGRGEVTRVIANCSKIEAEGVRPSRRSGERLVQSAINTDWAENRVEAALLGATIDVKGSADDTCAVLVSAPTGKVTHLEPAVGEQVLGEGRRRTQ